MSLPFWLLVVMGIATLWMLVRIIDYLMETGFTLLMTYGHRMHKPKPKLRSYKKRR